MYMKFWYEILKGGDFSEDIGEDNIRMDLK
jgi:hypothetical protein